MKSIVTTSPKYQLLISDIKQLKHQVDTVINKEENLILKTKLRELLELKSFYNNIQTFVETVKEV